MGILSWLFDPEPEDALGHELREALATIIKRAMSDGEGAWSLNIYRCSIRGFPIGSWRLTVQRIADEKEHGT